MSLETKLAKYAELIVKRGVNVQPGQTIILYAAVDEAYFARQIVAAAYEAGAREVVMEWSDQTIAKSFLNNAPTDRLENVPEYDVLKANTLMDKYASRISLVSQDPDGLAGVPADRLQTYTLATQKALGRVREATMKDDISWLVVAAAGQAWAEKVFPDLKGQAAVERLWEEILKDVRVDDDSDAIANWTAHIATLKAKADWLNTQNFKALHYQNAQSDFTIGLAEGHIWEAALSEDKAGHVFIPNMPTEEVFTAPDNRHIDGHVAATMPLSYQGNVIENITLDFENGRIVKASATKGQAVLEKLIATDAGAQSLGEVSLVPDPSPIAQGGVLFYNTLFDENASDHLAIGAAYNSNIQGGKTEAPEVLAQRGWNISDVHVDFMIGSADMAIDGITQDGQTVPVFRHGDWA
ncbi:aminopeptidase [Leuconostoc holzapfelii]|uniref:Aminopeptidase n=1 Tax=Leuconostoc holzapfelii TaxID=434464 RepID=A0A846ZG93_9LACO|nr:aminopeptidase [Leuconostoc holzapfelii]MCT8389242.1 aminopeptidase [Leuconostoc holzapfelii]NKZ18022.1 aminopeptidase [Leuconostoc holzapfelii]